MSETNNSTGQSQSNATAEATQANTEVKQSANPQEGTAQVQPQPNKKKFKLKVDGNEEEMELDLNDEAALTRHLQMSKAASKRMNEAAITRKQAADFINALQNDPMRVLSDPRIMGNEKFQQIAEQFLAKKLQDQMLSPEEKKRIEMEEKLRSYEEQEKKQREEAEHEQIRVLEEHYAQQFQKTIITALDSSNLPKNPYTVKRMAELLKKNIQHGLELDPQHLAQLVREDYQRELVSLIGSSEADQIIGMFGDDITNKIRKHDLAKFKTGYSTQPQQKTNNNTQGQSTEKRKMRADEYEAYIRSKK